MYGPKETSTTRADKMYTPKPGTFFSRRGYVFRCLYIDNISILFEDRDGVRFLDTAGDNFEPASEFPDDVEVEVWDAAAQAFFPCTRCPGEQRVRVDYFEDLGNLAVYRVLRSQSSDEFTVASPTPLNWRIDLT